jgi:hypothetical protein
VLRKGCRVCNSKRFIFPRFPCPQVSQGDRYHVDASLRRRFSLLLCFFGIFLFSVAVQDYAATLTFQG